LTYAYYPGCSLESTAREYDLSVRAVAARLSLALRDLPDWTCCGASAGHSSDRSLGIALSTHSLALAEQQGLDMLVACPACYVRFREARSAAEGAHRKGSVDGVAGLPYTGRHHVRHLLDVLVNEVGLERIFAEVARSLEGIKAVCYYGCYLVRPPKLVGFDDPENPQLLDRLMAGIGVNVNDWSSKVDCCGGSLSLTRRDVAARLVHEIVQNAREAGAEMIVSACPLCQVNLETRQVAGQERMPIVYFTELLGLSMGVPDAGSWFARHLVSVKRPLQSHGLWSPGRTRRRSGARLAGGPEEGRQG
jgi:heterodisulfide reductase subunit B2